MLGIEETAKKLLASAGAASLSQVWRLVVTFLTHMALRRMMPPEVVGPWSWAEPLFMILAQVRDLGVPGHIVRDKDRAYGSFLRIQWTWGFAFAGLVFAAAPWIAARFYQDLSSPVVEIIRALCVFLVVHGLGAVALIYFEAELEVIKTIPAELARNAVFAGLSLTMAWQGFGVWSLVVGHIAAAAVFAAMLWWAALKEMKAGRFELRHSSSMITLIWVSLPLMVMAILEQLVLKLDSFIVAMSFDSAVVGATGLAIYAVFFFSRLLADPIGRALYPALVRYSDEPDHAFEAYRVATVFLGSLVAPLAFFLYVNAEAVALILGGKDWLDAAEYLRFLSLVPLIRPLTMFGLELLLTRHMDWLLVVYTFTNLVTLGAAGLWLTQTDLEANGMALAGYFPLGILFLAWGIHSLSPERFGLLLRNLFQLYLVAGLVLLPIYYLVPASSPVTRFVLSCLSGFVAVGYSWWRFGGEYLRFLRREV